MTKFRPIAVVGMAGIFPGANTLEEFWKHIENTQVAPLRSLGPRWGIDRSRYISDFPGVDDKIYWDQAFCLDEAWGDSPEVDDRQTRIGRLVVERALGSVSSGTRAPNAEETALVVATSWTDPSYFTADAKLTLNRLGFDTKVEMPQLMLSPDAQLEFLVDEKLVAGQRIAVDTACASSLYAVDYARGLLAREEAKRVVVLGLNLTLSFFLYVGLCKVQAISPKGRILPFGNNASGMVPGECAAAIVLENTPSAIENHRKIFGLISGIGLSADGADKSVFAPSYQGQSLAYERAYRDVDPGTIAYVEAHGTGTPVGDATELASLSEFFSPHLVSEKKIPVGSVKSLIGHTLAAAGLASIIKGLLVLENRVVPKHIALDQVNPKIEQTCLYIPEESKAIDLAPDVPLRLGISSFGFGGANSHLVLESYQGEQYKKFVTVSEAVQEPAGKSPKKSATPFEPIAVVDMECVLASMNDGVYFSGAPLGSGCGVSLPPAKRFGFSAEEDLEKLGPGYYLKKTLKIDAEKLRMGPNFLRRHDAVQLLLTDCVHRIVNRNKDSLDVDTTAVVVSSNLGGTLSLAQSRKYMAKYGTESDAWERAKTACPEIDLQLTVDSVTSGLPNMSSGFSAFHFDLKGFHQTLSGSSKTFWNSLFMAPFWLEQSCSSLLLGAARLLKGPVDVKLCAMKSGPKALPVGEGLSFYLLKNLSTAKKDGNRIYGTIDAIIKGSEYVTADEACALAAVDRDSVVSWQVCDVDNAIHDRANLAQQQAGFLLEATGAETFVNAFRGNTGKKVIEIVRGNDSIATIFLTVDGLFEQVSPNPGIPVETSLFSYGQENTKVESNEMPMEKAVCTPMSDAFSVWNRETSRGILKYFETQKSLLESNFGASSRMASVHQNGQIDVGYLRKNRENIVITQCRQLDAGLCATLVVDEMHPYFFDHKLDHVPGILLFEGVYQLSEVALAQIPGPVKDNRFGIAEINIRFSKFAEKYEPISIELVRRSQGVNGFQVKLRQKGQVIATSDVRLDNLQDMQDRETIRQINRDLVKDKALLHKRNSSNILVSDLRADADNRYVCDAFQPTGEHLFLDGDKSFLSPLYLLEAARQGMMLAAHTVLSIPKGQPMTLVSMGVCMKARIRRNTPVKLVFEGTTPLELGNIVISDSKVSIFTPLGERGSVSIKTQVVDPQLYEQQRWGS